MPIEQKPAEEKTGLIKAVVAKGKSILVATPSVYDKVDKERLIKPRRETLHKEGDEVHLTPEDHEHFMATRSLVGSEPSVIDETAPELIRPR